jgi:uncharacterized protein (DUF2062 family)
MLVFWSVSAEVRVAGMETVDPLGGEPRITRPPRRSAGWLRRLYLTLRTEHTTPGKVAGAVGVGVFVGCSPFWGLHLAMCVLLATVFRLNRMLVYAACNVANPLTAPFLVFAEVQVGHRILSGTWFGLTYSEFRSAGIADLFVSFLLGGIVIGLALGLLLGGAAYVVARAGRLPDAYQRVVDLVVRRYLDVSIRDAEAVRARLFKDPIYRFLLEEDVLRKPVRILDLGCGRGIVPALSWAVGGPAPASRSYLGVDVLERYVRVGREALDDLPSHTFQATDLRDFDPPPSDLVLLLNVLRHVPPTAQDALLRRLGKSLPPGAKLLVWDADASAGLRYRLTLVSLFFEMLVPGRKHPGLWCRRASDLKNALVAAGFEVVERTTHRGVSRARVLIEATRKPTLAART